MSSQLPAAEKALRDLHGLVRRSPIGTEPAAMTRRLPADLATSESQVIGLLADEVRAAEKATAAVLGDLRFEHLDRADEKVWRFVAECWADRSVDHVPAFVALHAAEVNHVTCYIPVEFLTVSIDTQFPGLDLLPVTDPRVPPANPWFVMEKPTGCVAAVEVEGSSCGRMAERARGRTTHV